ncbi:hypothetical protein BDC45DRAFT_237248 [Circinella umbellata]|nr:hypothetical protein BDC45DRAFT_237248 [Circinella umbellata]
MEELEQLRTTLQSTRVEGLKTLKKVTKSAGKRVRNIVQDESESDSSQEKDDVEGDKEDEWSTYSELDDVDKLIKVFLHYTNGESIVGEEKSFVKQMIDKKESIRDRLLGAAASNLLLENGWNYQIDINTKLCLSSIVNLISPESVNFLKTILTPLQFDSLQTTSSVPLQGLSEQCLKTFDELINDR